ncbi:hypothetical protein HMI56_007359 [Coelomomyces lativittatus]|nr:hypothetical protein HMI56_007359 [Coelomomyces lativittatus]
MEFPFSKFITFLKIAFIDRLAIYLDNIRYKTYIGIEINERSNPTVFNLKAIFNVIIFSSSKDEMEAEKECFLAQGLCNH